jgi:hypothetical protein
MTTSPVRTNIHICDLPPLPSVFRNRDLRVCDDCGRYWRAWIAPHFEWAAEWLPLSRFAGWRIARQARKEQKRG